MKEKTQLTTLTESARTSQQIVTDEGMIDVNAMLWTLRHLVTEVLNGKIQTSKASTAIRGIRTMVAIADSCRRSSDAAQPLLRVGNGKIIDAE